MLLDNTSFINIFIQYFLFNSTIMDQRVFYSLLERVGGNGRYQTILFCIWAFLYIVMGINTFFLPFVLYQNPYQCPEGVTNCNDYVCALPAEQRTPFIHNDLFSLATKFGDSRCDNNVELDRLQSFIYFGGVVGVLIGAFLNQIVTKRQTLLITLPCNIIGLGLAILGNSLLMASIGLFLNFSACAIQFQIVQCIIVETVSQEVREKYVTMVVLFHGLGVALNGLIFYLLKNAITVILTNIPIYVVILLFVIFYMQETPFDLIISSTAEQSLAGLKKIAAYNSRDNEHNITIPELENVKNEFSENQKKNDHSNISILDLFRYDSLRNLTLVSLVLHYMTSYQFVAPEIAVRNYSMSIYLNAAVIGLSELVGSVVCILLITEFARKKLIYASQALCCLTSAVIVFFLSCPNGNCSQTTKIMQTVGLVVFRFAATITFNAFYIQQYQAFPNQIRGLAIQFLCFPSYSAGITLPQIITLCEKTGVSVVITFIICTIIIVTMTIFLPETFGIPPPEIIEELKYQHHQVKDPKQYEKIKET